MQTIRQRNVAYKLLIRQLFDGTFIHGQEENATSFLNLGNENISRVNIIATVTLVSSIDKYSFAVIDDNTSSIRIKAWQQDASMVSALQPGYLVLVIARIREYNDERYLLPELVKKIENPNWLLARRLELVKMYDNLDAMKQDGLFKEEKLLEKVSAKSSLEKTSEKEKKLEQKETKEEKIEEKSLTKLSSSLRHKVINAIDSSESMDGISISETVKSSGISLKEADAVISELVKEGEIYEHKPGRYKLLQ